MRTIEENTENDKILSQVFADRIKKSRYSKSNQKVCDDLGIDFISNSPDERVGGLVLSSHSEGDYIQTKGELNADNNTNAVGTADASLSRLIEEVET